MVAATPGIFTSGASGQAAGAVLNSDWTLNSSSNTALDGTSVQIYAAGIGVPKSTALDDGSVSTLNYPNSCVAPSSYLSILNGTTTPQLLVRLMVAEEQPSATIRCFVLDRPAPSIP